MINNLPILNYTLSYRKDGGVYENSDVYISGLLERYVVKGLTPATKYFFKLQAANARGETSLRLINSSELTHITSSNPIRVDRLFFGIKNYEDMFSV